MAIYGWGRRLPFESRGELMRVPIPASHTKLRKPSQRQNVLQALLLAWCDSCPDEQLSTLLQWQDHWRPVLETHDEYWIPSPAQEFYCRCATVDVRREKAVAQFYQDAGVFNDPNELTRKLANKNAFDLWKCLLREGAIQSPSAEPPPPDPAEWAGWFDSALSSVPFAQIADLATYLPLPPNRKKHIVELFWIWRHGIDHWRKLLAHAFCNQGPWVFDRLAEIVPSDEIDSWDDLMLHQSEDHGEMRAFCKWISPQYAEILRPHFHHSDRDWRACAYQNYLAKTPEPILRHQWRLLEDLPNWQAKLLDRRLFAPELVRPAAIVEDIQTVEGDLRLGDPFNHRAL